MSSSEAYLAGSGQRTGLRERSVRAGVITAGGQGVKFILHLATTIVLARLLTPKDYGLVALVTAFTAVIGIFREAGLSSATIQRPSLSQAEVSGLFWMNIVMGIVTTVTLAAAAYPIAAFYSNPNLILVTFGLACTGLISSLGIQHSALLQRRMEFRQLAVRDVVAQTVGAAAGITSALYGARYWSLVIMQAATSGASVILLWIACPWRPSAPARFSGARALAGFGANVTGANLVGHLSKGLDAMTLGYFFGTDSVGIYNRAQNLLALPLRQVLTPIMSVARPALARAAEDGSRFRSATVELLSLVAFTSALATAMVVPVSDLLISVFLGPQWSDCIPIFVALAPFAFVEPCASVLGSVLIAAGKPAAFLRWRFISIFSIVLGIGIGVQWGPVGIALGFSLGGLLLRTPWFIYFVSRHTDLPFGTMIMAIAPSALQGTASALMAWLLRPKLPVSDQALEAFLTAVLAALLYFGLSALTPTGRGNLARILATWRALRRRNSRSS